jgi:hypothetical protein
MRHATCGLSFRARAFATMALMAVGVAAAMAGLVDALMR